MLPSDDIFTLISISRSQSFLKYYVSLGELRTTGKGQLTHVCNYHSRIPLVHVHQEQFSLILLLDDPDDLEQDASNLFKYSIVVEDCSS
jgi:hypothetical protein